MSMGEDHIPSCSIVTKRNIRDISQEPQSLHENLLYFWAASKSSTNFHEISQLISSLLVWLSLVHTTRLQILDFFAHYYNNVSMHELFWDGKQSVLCDWYSMIHGDACIVTSWQNRSPWRPLRKPKPWHSLRCDFICVQDLWHRGTSMIQLDLLCSRNRPPTTQQQLFCWTEAVAKHQQLRSHPAAACSSRHQIRVSRSQ